MYKNKNHHSFWTSVALTCLAIFLAPGLAQADEIEGGEPRVHVVSSYEVDPVSPDGRTTLVSLHNPGPDPLAVVATIYGRGSDRLAVDTMSLGPLQRIVLDLRTFAPDLVIEGDGIARGWVRFESFSTSAASSAAGNQLWGDWFIIDDPGTSAAGASGRLLSPDQLCGTLELPLMGGDDDATLRIFATKPRGQRSNLETATLFAYSEDGDWMETTRINAEDSVIVLKLRDYIETESGTLRIQFERGAGSAAGEYVFYGRYFDAAAVCVE